MYVYINRSIWGIHFKSHIKLEHVFVNGVDKANVFNSPKDQDIIDQVQVPIFTYIPNPHWEQVPDDIQSH